MAEHFIKSSVLSHASIQEIADRKLSGREGDGRMSRICGDQSDLLLHNIGASLTRSLSGSVQSKAETCRPLRKVSFLCENAAIGSFLLSN